MSASERLIAIQQQWKARQRLKRWILSVFLVLVGGLTGGALTLWAIRAPIKNPSYLNVPWRGPLPPVSDIAAGHNTAIPGWHLIWDDEFDSRRLTQSLWDIMNYHYPYNQQLQFYASRNVTVSDGALHVLVNKQPFDGFSYTSGMVTTKTTQSFLYGMIVISAKLPAGQGLFPAIWMLPATGRSTLPEVDIMEAIGRHPHHVYMTLHYNGPHGGVINIGAPYSGPNFSKNYHRYALIWTPTKLVWLVDGVVRYQESQYVPHKPLYLLMNVAVGGSWPGAPTATDHWPQQLSVQYVRVYQSGAAPKFPPQLSQ